MGGGNLCRKLDEVREAVEMFSNKSVRSLGTRRAEEQELLVQDVKLDITGIANMMGRYAYQALPVF